MNGTVAVRGTATARFPWWSFIRTVLAICTVRLVEEGFPKYGRFQCYHDAVARHDPPWFRGRLPEAVDSDRLDIEPSTDWAYSNVGYLLVCDAIEQITHLNLATPFSVS
jgi:D-alanyl-D-alanine carboxypeptidase